MKGCLNNIWVRRTFIQHLAVYVDIVRVAAYFPHILLIPSGIDCHASLLDLLYISFTAW